MRSFSCPKPLFHGLSDSLNETKFAKSDLSMGWTLLRPAGWLATIAIVAVLIWHITGDGSLWSQAIAGLLLVAIGLLAGLRLGNRSATTYIQDIQRTNKTLADQNKELEAANAVLLKELDAQAEPASRSQSA